MRDAIRTRQLRLAEIGETLAQLSDSESRTRLDPLRLRSKRQLGKKRETITQLLEARGDAFAGPEAGPHALIESTTSASPSEDG
jgi:hypothetical protein